MMIRPYKADKLLTRVGYIINYYNIEKICNKYIIIIHTFYT